MSESRNLASHYMTASTREKLNLSVDLLDSVVISNNASSKPLTACELARIALAQAILTEALACGPGE